MIAIYFFRAVIAILLGLFLFAYVRGRIKRRDLENRKFLSEEAAISYLKSVTPVRRADRVCVTLTSRSTRKYVQFLIISDDEDTKLFWDLPIPKGNFDSEKSIVKFLHENSASHTQEKFENGKVFLIDFDQNILTVKKILRYADIAEPIDLEIIS